MRSLIIIILTFFLHYNQSVYVSIRTYSSSLFFHTWLLKSDVIQPDRFKNMEVYSMYFHPAEPYEQPHQTIKTVRMMLQLELLYISNFSMHELPYFEKLPKLRKLAIVNNEITELKNDSFVNLPLSDLFLSGNKIERIQEQTFQANLKDLFLNCNNISELSSNWFVTPEKLEVLNLVGNFITHLKKDTLKKFIGLKALDLAFNKMFNLESSSLTGPATMNYLSLANNNLTTISPTVFATSNNTITYLDITYNRLTFLKEEFLEKLNLERFEIRGNPWQCPCYKKIEQWMTKKGIMLSVFRHFAFDENEVKCIYAQSFSNFCIELYDDELYQTYSINLTTNVTREGACTDCDKLVQFLFVEMRDVFKLPHSSHFKIGNYKY